MASGKRAGEAFTEGGGYVSWVWGHGIGQVTGGEG